jgi:hypothetical protein
MVIYGTPTINEEMKQIWTLMLTQDYCLLPSLVKFLTVVYKCLATIRANLIVVVVGGIEIHPTNLISVAAWLPS